jgi:hypothetical protein
MLEVGNDQFEQEKKEKSKWLFKFGMEYLKYPIGLPDYTGENEKVREGTQEDVTGVGLAFGREFYIGKGFSTNLNLGGFYFKTLNKKSGQATKEYDIEIASVRDGYYIYGYEAALSLNYLFDFKMVDVQPFVEFSVGTGHAEIEKMYNRENITASANGEEIYDVSSNEDFNFSKISFGLNFIAFKGLMSYVKASTMIVNKTSRENQGKTSVEGSGDVIINTKNDELDETEAILAGQIGIGYFF